MKPEQQEIDRLRRELARMRAERYIPKKPRPTLPGTRYEVRVHRKTSRDLAGVGLCAVLDVSRSGFHAWLVRAPSDRSLSDEAYAWKIRASFIFSYRTYGARCVWHDLLPEGL